METFYEYMQDFLQKKEAKTVIEVGSDVQLRLAMQLAPHCERFYSVNFPGDHSRMAGWHELHQEMAGVRNIELKSGNALRLSELVQHADVIVVQNTMIELEDGDAARMWKYRRGEIRCTKKGMEELKKRFGQAEERAYREFLRVANPGYVIRFDWPELQQNVEAIWKKLKIEPRRIKKERLLSDEKEAWIAYIVDNTNKLSQ